MFFLLGNLHCELPQQANADSLTILVHTISENCPQSLGARFHVISCLTLWAIWRHRAHFAGLQKDELVHITTYQLDPKTFLS